MDFVIALRENYDVALPQYFGLHGYVEEWITASQLNYWWSGTKRIIEQVGVYQIVELWITEFADTTGDTKSFEDLLQIMQSNPYITKYAYFTNRYDPGAAYIPQGWHDFNLINGDGSLSPMGEVYKVN